MRKFDPDGITSNSFSEYA